MTCGCVTVAPQLPGNIHRQVALPAEKHSQVSTLHAVSLGSLENGTSSPRATCMQGVPVHPLEIQAKPPKGICRQALQQETSESILTEKPRHLFPENRVLH